MPDDAVRDNARARFGGLANGAIVHIFRYFAFAVLPVFGGCVIALLIYAEFAVEPLWVETMTLGKAAVNLGLPIGFAMIVGIATGQHLQQRRIFAIFQNPLGAYLLAAVAGALGVFGLFVLAYLIYAEFGPPALWGDNFTLGAALENGWGALVLGVLAGVLYRRRARVRGQRD